jgi:hypothetical protein
MKNLICAICNNSFTQDHWKQKFCSQKCAKKFEIIRKRISQEKYLKKNWEIIKKKNLIIRKKRIEKDSNYTRSVYEVMKKNNPETIKRFSIKNRESIRNDPEKLKRRRNTINQWFKKKRKTDPFYKIRGALSGRLNSFLKNNNIKKSNSILELIGCTKDQLIKHLESKFYNHIVTNEQMNWGNYGKKIHGKKNTWEVDHILPYNHFKNEDLNNIEVQKIINHFTNLQPLWAEENRSKSDKIKIIK